MDKQKFFDLAKAMVRIKKATDGFTQMHLYRFFHFVQSSDLGLECRYAEATFRAFFSENEKETVKAELRKMKRDIDTLLQELNDL